MRLSTSARSRPYGVAVTDVVPSCPGTGGHVKGG